MAAKIAYESLHLKVKRNISTSNYDMSLLGQYLGGALLPTHLQVRNAESFFCILNTSTRVDTLTKVFCRLNYRKSICPLSVTPKLVASSKTGLKCPIFMDSLEVSPAAAVTHLSLVVPCGCIAALVQAPRGQGPVGGRCHGLALCSVAPSREFPPQSAAVLCRRSYSRGIKLLHTPLNTLWTCSDVSLASSAFLQCVPRFRAHGLQAVVAFILSAAVLVHCPVPPLATLYFSHCVPKKGGSCRNSCGSCLIPVASFNAMPLFHSSSQFSAGLSLH